VKEHFLRTITELIVKTSKILVLVGIVFGMGAYFMSCGADDKDEDTSSETPAIVWDDVAPIITKSCVASSSGVSCHSSAGSNTFNWETATEETFAAGTTDRTRFKARLAAEDMPPAEGATNIDNIQLVEADRETLNSYFK
jgi:hypothetical protein